MKKPIKKHIHMKRIILVFIPTFFMMSSLNSTGLTLPKPKGPYSVGTQSIELRDPSRAMLRGDDPRRWMVQAFYPSEKHEGTYPYMPGTLEGGDLSGTKISAFAKPDAPAIKSQKFPVIIFIPGRGGERQKYTIILEELASHGYIILSLDQPYVANFVRFPDGKKIVLTLKDVWKLPRDRDYRYAYDDEVIEGAIKDIAYVLGHFSDLGRLSESCNPSKVILMGHSLGGNVAHIMGFKDRRVKGIVDIDSKITERKVFGRIGAPDNPHATPILFIRGMMQHQEDVGRRSANQNSKRNRMEPQC